MNEKEKIIEIIERGFQNKHKAIVSIAIIDDEIKIRMYADNVSLLNLEQIVETLIKFGIRDNWLNAISLTLLAKFLNKIIAKEVSIK